MRRNKVTILLLMGMLFSLFYYDANAQHRRHRHSPQTVKNKASNKDNISRRNEEDSIDVSRTAWSVFTMYPTSYFISTLKAGYEVKLGAKSTFKLIGSFGTAEHSDFYDVNKMTEYAVQVQSRFYVTSYSHALNGFYMAVYANYRNMDFYNDPYRTVFDAYTVHNQVHYKASAFTFGYGLGYQSLLPSGFVIDFFGEGGVNLPSGDNEQIGKTGNFSTYLRGIVPQVGFCLGFAL